MAGKRKRELTEEAALEIALRDHPEWRRAWEQGELPDETIGEEGRPMSPRAHLHIHAVVYPARRPRVRSGTGARFG